MKRLLIASLFSLAACGTGTPGESSTDSANTNKGGVGAAPTTGFAPTLVTLSGVVDASDLPSLPPAIRVAVVWPTAGADHEAESTSVALKALPTRYNLNVVAPPPEAAMQRVPAAEATAAKIDASQFRFAVGNVIAYVDANGSGKRDNGEQIIAMPNATVIYYLEGTPPAGAVQDANGYQEPLAAGFNLETFQYGIDDGAPGPVANGAVVTPITSDIDLELMAQAAPTGLLCATGFGAIASVPPESGSAVSVGTSTFPPAGATVDCIYDGSIFLWTLCSGDAICGERCTTGQNTLTTTTAPANWPCTLNR